MFKNYYLYTIKNKTGKEIIKRQAINLNDIYPESYALGKIPDNAKVFAKIKDNRGIWQKHELKSIHNSDIEWKEKQIQFVKKYYALLTDKNELELLYRDGLTITNE